VERRGTEGCGRSGDDRRGGDLPLATPHAPRGAAGAGASGSGAERSGIVLYIMHMVDVDVVDGWTVIMDGWMVKTSRTGAKGAQSPPRPVEASGLRAAVFPTSRSSDASELRWSGEREERVNGAGPS